MSFAWLRFHSQATNELSPAVARPKLTQKVAFVVLDGLRRDRFDALFPRLRGRATAQGVLCDIQCPELTFTATGVYTLGTGDLPTLSLLPSNFQAHPADVDSLPWAIQRAHGRSIVFGESVWSDLFGANLRSGASERDHGPYSHSSESSVRDAYANSLRTNGCELCIWHDPKLDKLGHRFGIYGDEYQRYARELDQYLDQLIVEVGQNTTFVITSDHGMTDSGNHGGAQPEARSSFLAITGKGVRHERCSESLAQTSIAPILSVLLGAPIPFAAQGKLPDIFTRSDGSDFWEQLQDEEKDHLLRYGRTLVIRRGGEAASAISSASEARAEIDRAHREASRGLLLLALVPLLILLGSHARVLAGWSKLLWAGLAFSATSGWIFGNVVYPRWSFSDAAILHLATVAVLLIAGAAWSRRLSESRRVTWVAGVLTVILTTSDSHWIVFLEPLTFGLFGWATGARASRACRFLRALAMAGVGSLVTLLGWTHSDILSLVSSLRRVDVFIGIVSSGLCGVWISRRKFGRGCAFLGLACALAYVLARQIPSELRLLLAVAVCLGQPLLGFRWRRMSDRAGALLLAALLFFSAQMGALEWSLTLLLGMLFGRGLATQSLDQALGNGTAAQLRALVLLGLGYLWVAVLGNQLDFSDVQVLVGLVGGAVPLSLPVVVPLTALFYAAPVLVALCVWVVRCGVDSRVWALVQATRVLVGLRLAFQLVSFTWGRMAWGSWEKQLLEVLLLLAWLHVVEFSSLYLGETRETKARPLVSVDHPTSPRSKSSTSKA